MTRVKIHGAGSIGNHLANASRALGWDVDVCDVDPAALARTRNEIYPSRYGSWDEKIRLFRSDEAPTGGYDLIFIGTPPDSHVPLARLALEEKPRAILVEKPVCGPDLDGLKELEAGCRARGIAGFVGYDHVVGKAAVAATEKALQHAGLLTLDVEFREHWGGIFTAHPWLDGPRDSYLGFWRRGGGALGEHSHALNLWQHWALASGAGRVVEVSAELDYVEQNGAAFDRLAALSLKTERGLVGRVVQDVITKPTRKWARLQYSDGAIEWQAAVEPGIDAVRVALPGEAEEVRVKKTRPDDFIAELTHIDTRLREGTAEDSPIALTRGLETMVVIAAAHRSAQTGRRVRIDWSEGYTPAALKTKD
jgi:predicted dehydrogenase